MDKRKAIGVAILAVVLMVVIGQIYIARSQVKFDGSRVCSKDPWNYYLVFNLMNKADTQTMTLKEGETLHVAWQIDKGRADFKIAMADETPIYRADKCSKGEDADFDLLIPKTGEYTTTITAYHAKGWVKIGEN